MSNEFDQYFWSKVIFEMIAHTVFQSRHCPCTILHHGWLDGLPLLVRVAKIDLIILFRAMSTREPLWCTSDKPPSQKGNVFLHVHFAKKIELLQKFGPTFQITVPISMSESFIVDNSISNSWNILFITGTNLD